MHTIHTKTEKLKTQGFYCLANAKLTSGLQTQPEGRKIICRLVERLVVVLPPQNFVLFDGDLFLFIQMK